MRRTFFPSALFGLCSTCLLLLGLSSLRSDPRLFAQSQHPDRYSPDSNDSFSEVWFTPDDFEEAYYGESPCVEDDWTFSWLDIDPDAWDTGAVPGDPSVNDPKAGYATSSEPSGYRYYYRFVAEDPWSGDSTAMDQEASEPWLWLSDLPEDSGDLTGPSEYGFIDEYSSEEAARYEMAQEGCWRNDEMTLADTDGDLPWYEESYELLQPQENVGGRGGRCLILNRRTLAGEGSVGAKMITVAELEAELQAERAQAYHQPDYEADVAAGWLFAANRSEDLDDLAFNPSSDGEIDAFEFFEEEIEEIDDEAYEQWEVLEEQDVDAFSTEEINEWDEADDYLGTTVPETPSAESEPRHDSAATSPEDAEEPYESWIIVNHEPIVGISSGDSEPPASVGDTPWHGEPGENFVWPMLAEETDVASPAAEDDLLEEQTGAMDRGDEDQFLWMDPADDRYYDSSFEDNAEQEMLDGTSESGESISGWDVSQDENDPSTGDLGEEWDVGERGYRPAEMAAPVADPFGEHLSPGEDAYEDATNFQGEGGDSVSLKRMGAALVELVSPLRFWH